MSRISKSSPAVLDWLEKVSTRSKNGIVTYSGVVDYPVEEGDKILNEKGDICKIYYVRYLEEDPGWYMWYGEKFIESPCSSEFLEEISS